MRDNVTITNESYVGPRGGFGVEDYLIPKKPTTTADVWFEPYQDTAGLSLSGGLNNPSGNQQSEAKADTGLKAEDVDLSRVQPQRRRRSFGVQAMARGIDLFDMVSGVDKDAYLGKTLANEIEYEKKLAEEDPEGYQADVNRAKLLSQRAYETEDVELKKKYGAAIKKLLPAETAGLDDLTASAYYTGNEKMEIEKLKASTQLAREKVKGEYGLQKQDMQGENRIDVANLNNASRESIAAARNATQMQVHQLDNAVKQAIQDGKNDIALQLMDKRADLQTALHIMDNEADYNQELMKQAQANYRTEYAADRGLEGRVYSADVGYDKGIDVANINQGGANYRANLSADTQIRTTQMNNDARMEQEKVRQANANLRALVNAKYGGSGKGDNKSQQAQAMVDYLTSPEQVAEFDRLNQAAGAFSWGGETWGTFVGSQRGQAWGQLESYMTRGIVQLAKSLGSNPSNEDARRISNMFGLNSHLSPSRRREAWFNTLKYVAAISGAGLPVDGSVSPEQAQVAAQTTLAAPQSTINMENIISGKAVSGQPVTASGNYVF